MTGVVFGGDWQRDSRWNPWWHFFPSSPLRSRLSPPLIFCIENLRTKWSRGESDRSVWHDTDNSHLRLLYQTTCHYLGIGDVFLTLDLRVCSPGMIRLSGHCLLMVIYFINVPLIEMAAREKRGKSDWKWLHVIDAHHRGEQEIPLEIRRRRVIWLDQKTLPLQFSISTPKMFRDPEMPYFFFPHPALNVTLFWSGWAVEVGWHRWLVLKAADGCGSLNSHFDWTWDNFRQRNVLFFKQKVKKKTYRGSWTVFFCECSKRTVAHFEMITCHWKCQKTSTFGLTFYSFVVCCAMHNTELTFHKYIQ